MHRPLLIEASRHLWAITPHAMRGILNALEGDLSEADYSRFHGISREQKAEFLAQFGDAVDGTKYTRRDGNVGLLFVSGPILPRASMLSEMSGLVSAETLGKEFNALEADASVDQIVFVMDTPGGAITGISELASSIKASDKATTAYVFGMAASAGYWIASAADKVISADTGLAGSIGVVSTFYTKRDDTSVEIVSTQSPKKRIDINTDDGRQEAQGLVDDLASVFVGTVATNRSVSADTVLERFGKGSVMVASKALEAGMVDGIASLSNLVNGYKTDNKVSSPVYAGSLDKVERTIKMNLQELLAQYPGVKEEIEQQKAEAFARGVESGKADAAKQNTELMTFAGNILASDAYPRPVKDLAIEAIKGDVPVGELKAAVRVFDALAARDAVASAGAASAEAVVKPEQNIETKSANGEIRSAADINAAIENLHGMKVEK
jgi:ClpP class serine protease